jgi:hypothetical protein
MPGRAGAPCQPGGAASCAQPLALARLREPRRDPFPHELRPARIAEIRGVIPICSHELWMPGDLCAAAGEQVHHDRAMGARTPTEGGVELLGATAHLSGVGAGPEPWRDGEIRNQIHDEHGRGLGTEGAHDGVDIACEVRACPMGGDVIRADGQRHQGRLLLDGGRELARDDAGGSGPTHPEVGQPRVRIHCAQPLVEAVHVGLPWAGGADAVHGAVPEGHVHDGRVQVGWQPVGADGRAALGGGGQAGGTQHASDEEPQHGRTLPRLTHPA